MKNYTYYVYLIPGIKIGCTTDLEKRMSDQGFTQWEILWQQDGDYDFGWIAGEKEIELQKLHGYLVDKVNYQISRMNRPVWNEDTTHVFTKEECINGGKIGGKIVGQKNVESGHIFNIGTFEGRSKGGKKAGKLCRKLTYKDAEEIRRIYEIKNISKSKLAEQYSVNRVTILRIIKRERYNEA